MGTIYHYPNNIVKKAFMELLGPEVLRDWHVIATTPELMKPDEQGRYVLPPMHLENLFISLLNVTQWAQAYSDRLFGTSGFRFVSFRLGDAIREYNEKFANLNWGTDDKAEENKTLHKEMYLSASRLCSAIRDVGTYRLCDRTQGKATYTLPPIPIEHFASGDVEGEENEICDYRVIVEIPQRKGAAVAAEGQNPAMKFEVVCDWELRHIVAGVLLNSQPLYAAESCRIIDPERPPGMDLHGFAAMKAKAHLIVELAAVPVVAAFDNAEVGKKASQEFAKQAADEWEAKTKQAYNVERYNNPFPPLYGDPLAPLELYATSQARRDAMNRVAKYMGRLLESLQSDEYVFSWVSDEIAKEGCKLTLERVFDVPDGWMGEALPMVHDEGDIKSIGIQPRVDNDDQRAWIVYYPLGQTADKGGVLYDNKAVAESILQHLQGGTELLPDLLPKAEGWKAEFVLLHNDADLPPLAVPTWHQDGTVTFGPILNDVGCGTVQPYNEELPESKIEFTAGEYEVKKFDDEMGELMEPDWEEIGCGLPVRYDLESGWDGDELHGQYYCTRFDDGFGVFKSGEVLSEQDSGTLLTVDLEAGLLIECKMDGTKVRTQKFRAVAV